MMNVEFPNCPPLYVAVVGQGGCGKTQAADFISQQLTELTGRQVVMVEEPSRKNRLNIFAAKKEGKPGLEIVKMFYRDRRDEVITPIIKPEMRSGRHVIGNRCYVCTWAYEGGGEGISDDKIARVHKRYLGDFFADLIVYMQLSDPLIGLKRKPSFEDDTFDEEKMDYHLRVKEKYDHLANSQRPEFWITIDADRSIPIVQKQIGENLCEYLKLRCV